MKQWELFLEDQNLYKIKSIKDVRFLLLNEMLPSDASKIELESTQLFLYVLEADSVLKNTRLPRPYPVTRKMYPEDVILSNEALISEIVFGYEKCSIKWYEYEIQKRF